MSNNKSNGKNLSKGPSISPYWSINHLPPEKVQINHLSLSQNPQNYPKNLIEPRHIFMAVANMIETRAHCTHNY